MFYISYLDDLDVASAERNKPIECGDAIFLILFEVQNNLLGSTNTFVVNSITQMPHTHTLSYVFKLKFHNAATHTAELLGH